MKKDTKNTSDSSQSDENARFESAVSVGLFKFIQRYNEGEIDGYFDSSEIESCDDDEINTRSVYKYLQSINGADLGRLFKSIKAIEIDRLLKLELDQIAEFCENGLNAEKLENNLQLLPRSLFAEPFYSRSALCQYLGIRESTLAGWLKEDRIPRMAKEAFILLKAFLILQDEVRGMRKERDEKGLKLIKDGDHYHVIRLQQDDIGFVVGEVVAKEITSEKEALLLVNAEKNLESADVLISEAPVNAFDYKMDTNSYFQDLIIQWDCQRKELKARRGQISSPDEARADESLKNETTKGLAEDYWKFIKEKNLPSDLSSLRQWIRNCHPELKKRDAEDAELNLT